MAIIQMKKLLTVYKPIGITPYQLIQQVKEHFPQYNDEPIGFAGRLDPLAHGVMLLMIGEATKERELYLNLSKTYEFEALLGIETDTYDLLGLIKSPQPPLPKEGETSFLHQFIQSKLGKQIQPYPPFSSKTVHGKPLFWWAKNDKLSEITIPEREIEIYDFKLLAEGTITAQQLQQKVTDDIHTIQGDFRQDEIKKQWNHFFLENKTSVFQTARFTIDCSSGTYVRGLAHDLGKQLGTGAITLEILRTKVGNYSLEESLKL